MRILHTIDSAGLYGAESMLLALAVEQQQRGNAPMILSIGTHGCPEKAVEQEATHRGLPCVPLRMRNGLNLLGSRRIFEVARRHGVDVIHSHGYKPDILLAALPRIMRTAPVVATLHGWTARGTFSTLGLYRFLDRCSLPRLDAVVAVKPMTLAGCDVKVIPNGISEDVPGVPDDELTHQIRDLRRNTGIVIGAVGRLSPEKNFGALFEALPSIPAHVGVAILGDGPERALLKNTIAARDLSKRVLMAGFVKDARRYLPLFDLLVIPSLTEGLPMILLEAMAANLPVLATRVGDVPAALGDIGVLIDAGNPGELTDALRTITSDLASYIARASGGSARVRQNYGASRMAAAYDEIYRSVKPATCVPPPK